MNTVSSKSPNGTRPKVVLIFGPTAVGKTDLLSEMFGEVGEVINADSMQVYRGMDIGTAKPASDLTRLIPHHLIDIRDPNEQFNAGDFVSEADRLVPEITGRGRLPVISGGTPFYLRNFIFGLPLTPPSDPEIRDQVRKDVERMGLSNAYAVLLEKDPKAAERISANDRYRIERALEVIQTSGKPFSDFAVQSQARAKFDMICIGLDRPRQELYGRINMRVEDMFSCGLVEEVAALFEKGYGDGDPGMQGIGYKEFSQMKSEGCETMPLVRDAIAKNSRRYAKRQLTFFRKFQNSRWFHPDQSAEIRLVVEQFTGRALT